MIDRPMTCDRSFAPIIARPAGFISRSRPDSETSFTQAGSALIIARSRLSLSAFSASADSSALGRAPVPRLRTRRGRVPVALRLISTNSVRHAQAALSKRGREGFSLALFENPSRPLFDRSRCGWCVVTLDERFDRNRYPLSREPLVQPLHEFVLEEVLVDKFLSSHRHGEADPGIAECMEPHGGLEGGHAARYVPHHV